MSFPQGTLLCENGPKSQRDERRSHREPLSGYARLIAGERSAPNRVCLTSALPGNSTLRRRMKRRRVHIFHSSGLPEALGTGRIPLFLFIFCPLPSPHSMSCIITSRFEERAGEEQHRESKGAQGGLKGGGGCMYVSVTRRCQQGDRLEKYFLACPRKGPLTGGLRHHKSSVILSMPLSLCHSPCRSLSLNSRCSVESNLIHNFPSGSVNWSLTRLGRPHVHTASIHQSGHTL